MTGWIGQRADNDCGVACLAMIAGITWEEARRSFGLIPELGLYESDMLHWLNARGWLYQTRWVDGPLPEVVFTTSLSLVLLEGDPAGHWILVRDGEVLDPWRMAALPAAEYRAARVIALHPAAGA